MTPFSVACLAATLLPSVALANPSDQDAGFGDGGYRNYDFAVTDPYRPESIGAIGAIPGGYLAVVERRLATPQINEFLVRYDDRGNEVAAIDLGIRAQDHFGSRFGADGKLVILSFGFVGNEFGMVVQRRLANGDFDPSFGVDGRAQLADAGGRLAPYAISIDPQGRITIAGARLPVLGGSADDARLFVAQISSAGVPVATFGSDGLATLDSLPGEFEAPGGVVRTADGGALVCDTGEFGAQNDAIVTRLAPDGSLDAAFASGGTLYYDTTEPMQPNRQDACVALEMQPGTGVAYMAVSSAVPAVVNLVRIDASGNDPTTLSALIQPDYHPFQPAALAFDAQGRALLVVPEPAANSMFAFNVARYNASGTRDSNFGVSGLRRQLMPQPAGGNPATVRTLVTHATIDARGRILVATELEHTDSNFAGWSAMRLRGDRPFADGFED